MMSRGRERAAVLKRTEFVVKDVVEYMLKENGVRVNGYTSVLAGKVRDVSNEDACIRDDDFLRAREQIMTCCKFMKREYGRELAKMCKKLNVEDEQLHTNFLEVMNEIWGEESARNWGRLVSMLVAAYYICDRLHREESKDKAKAKIDSVIGWLSDYMKKNAVPWITDHGGYTGVLYGTNLELNDSQPLVDDCKSGYMAKAGIFTMAALGIGAAVVMGTIVGR